MTSLTHMAGLLLALAAALIVPAQATTITVTNGDFSSTSSVRGGHKPGGVCYQTNPSQACELLTGWTNTDGYSFISNVANLGNSAYQSNAVTLDALPATVPGGPTAGSYFLAVDGVAWGAPRGSISQTLSGLTIGEHYEISFYQAAAQQAGFTGATTEGWQVSLGNQTDYSTVMSTPSQGTHAWNKQTLDFTATSASELLSFYALGTPDGDPPFVLLDDIAILALPEPSTLAALGVGLIGLIALRRRRNASAIA
jgi:hypothetical protein